METSHLRLGDRVLTASPSLNGSDHLTAGTIRYIGPTHCDPLQRIWVGIEWDSVEEGDHDGRLGQKRYFDCETLFTCVGRSGTVQTAAQTSGSFVPLSDVCASRLGTTFRQALEARYCSGFSVTSRTKNPASDAEAILKTPQTLPGNTREPVRRTPVEFVGADRAEMHFNKYHLLDQVDVEYYYVKTSRGPGEEPLPVFPATKYLCLARSLFSSFAEVRDIISLMPKLFTLDLSRCRFARESANAGVEIPQRTPDVLKRLRDNGASAGNFLLSPWKGLPSTSDGCHSAVSIQRLLLRNSGVEWVDLQALAQIWPQITTLDLSSNPQLFDHLSHVWMASCARQCGILRHIETLVLNHCQIAYWETLRVLRILCPKLKTLGLNDNLLGDLEPADGVDVLGKAMTTIFPCLPSRSETSEACTSPCGLEITEDRGLQELWIDRNRITQWSTLSTLAREFADLKVLRWMENPLYLNDPVFSTSEQERQLPRQVVIALFPALRVLNGSDISECERHHAELYFVSLASRADASIITRIDPLMTHVQRLQNKFGCISPNSFAPQVPIDRQNHSSKIELTLVLRDYKAEAVHTPLAHVVPEVVRSVPPWLLVKDLKLVCQKLFRVPAATQKLYLSHAKESQDSAIELFDDECALAFYDVTQGSRIIVRTSD